MSANISELQKKSQQIKLALLHLASQESIHIGGDLSSADVMTVLWQYKLNYDPANPKDENRDRFVLSKGHASALLNMEQAMRGCYTTDKVISEYASDGGMFAMHACKLKNPFIEISTGSLGHGLPVACGIAEALKLKGNKRSKVYVLMGDGEQSEGSVWEAAMNAAHYKLDNLVAIIDCNGLQADGKTSDLTGIDPLAWKYAAFGWNAFEIDGHNVAAIVDALDNVPTNGKPTVIMAHTKKGHGVDFMENNVRWHAGKLTEEQYAQAKKEIGGRN